MRNATRDADQIPARDSEDGIAEPEVVKFRANFEGRSPLDELIREGARRMLQAAIDAEVDDFLAEHSGRRDVDAFVRREKSNRSQQVAGLRPEQFRSIFESVAIGIRQDVNATVVPCCEQPAIGPLVHTVDVRQRDRQPSHRHARNQSLHPWLVCLVHTSQ